MTMADNTIHDLLDEVNCADSCEAVTALCALIDELLKDIQHLELECIGTRYLLSQHMEEAGQMEPYMKSRDLSSVIDIVPCYKKVLVIRLYFRKHQLSVYYQVQIQNQQ